MRASKLLPEVDRRAIEKAVAEAEAKTSAEIVPVVAGSSGRYSRAEDVLALWCGVLGLVVLGLLSPERQVDLVEALIVFFFGLGFGAGVLARIVPLKRALASRAVLQDRAIEAAHRVFRAKGVGRTAGRSGVLLYVSLFERAAVVLADEGSAKALPAYATGEIRDALVRGMREGKPAEAFVRAIARAGERLAAVLPRAADDRNELGNRLHLLD